MKLEADWLLGFGVCVALCVFPDIASRAGSTPVVRVPAGDATGLAEALRLAPPGARLVLEGGSYRGNFELRSPVALQGTNGAEISSDHQGTVLRVFAPNVSIEGLEVRDGGDDITNTDACIYVEESADRVTIRGNQMTGCAWGIWVNGADQATIEDNQIQGTSQKLLSDRGNGIHLFDTRDSRVRNNRVELGRDGLYISNSERVLLEKNHMIRTRFGIHYMYSHRCSVNGNRVEDSLIGAAIMYSKELAVVGNKISGSREHGILLRDVLHSKIEANVSEHNGDGVFLGSSYYNTIRGNRFERNGLAAHVSNGSNENLVTENDFIDNQLQVRFLDQKSITWSHEGRGNYWSHYVGWDRNRDGVGDKRFLVTRITDRLTHEYPVLKVILHSPAMQLLQKIENQFPVISGPSIVDEHPLMAAVTR